MGKFYHYLVRRYKKFLQFLRNLYAPKNPEIAFEDKTYVSKPRNYTYAPKPRSHRCNDDYKNYHREHRGNYGQKYQRHEQHR